MQPFCCALSGVESDLVVSRQYEAGFASLAERERKHLDARIEELDLKGVVFARVLLAKELAQGAGLGAHGQRLTGIQFGLSDLQPGLFGNDHVHRQLSRNVLHTPVSEFRQVDACK
jgi:hypothetical protein